ncbi:MAG: hypothetical protein IJ829_01590 [Kiritimatiellae bacterium]|nr:hypothetical protein [Kiritimatiellia bacterium]
MKKLIILCLAVAAVAPVWAIQGTVRTETDSKKGDIKWQSRSKSYSVSYKKGATVVSAEYPLADVVSLDVDKPAGYDKAVENVQRGNGAAAIGVLTKIVQEYKMLKWDKPAGRYLVEAYISANNAQKAYEIATGIIAEDKSAAWKGDLAPAYWKSLLKLGKTSQLEALVKKAAISGDRAASASALVMRGDMILASEGESPEGLRKALTDAYLRVMLMYADEACRDARIEAMQRAANCFDKLGQAARAEQIRSQVRKI